VKNRLIGHARRPAGNGPPSSSLPAETTRPLVQLRPDSDGTSAPNQSRGQWARPLPLAGLLLVLLALLGYWSVYNQTTRRTRVLVAAHALAAGSVLKPADLQTAGLAGDPSVLAALVPAGQKRLIVGRTLTESVAAGVPVAEADLATPGSRAASFTLALPVLHALAGELRPGDRVTVLATYSTSGGQAVTHAVARNLVVIAVGRASGFAASSQTIPVTVALPDPSLASALALANEAGKLDLLREGSSGQAAPIPPASAPGGTTP
jgi:Flp pilus assembly protein CpaB